MNSNSIKAVLAQNRIPVGMQCFSGSPPLIEIIGLTGFDFVMIDTEHACIDSAQVEHLITVAENVGLSSLVRVAENGATAIRKALEAGAEGVIIPQVRDAEDVARAISAARYPPLGERGMCPSTRAARYSMKRWNDFVHWSNHEVLVVPIIEHPDAVARADEICGATGVEIILFGPGDLGQAMGFGADGMSRLEVQQALDHVIACADKHGKKVMAVPFPDLSAASCQALIDRGVRVLLHSVDELLFYQLCHRIIGDLKPVLTFG